MTNIPEVSKTIALANAQLGTDCLKNLLDGGSSTYAGTVPDSPEDDVGSATLLVKLYSNPSDRHGRLDVRHHDRRRRHDEGSDRELERYERRDGRNATFWRWAMGFGRQHRSGRFE